MSTPNFVKANPLNYLLAVVLLTSASSAQHVAAGGCYASVFGNENATAAITFDRELHYASAQHDAGKMALLVHYPLRVNDPRGTFYIKDAYSLQGRFDDVFTAPVRQAISRTPLEKANCLASGVMYGNGEVWVGLSDHGYVITAINIDEGKRPTKPQVGRVRFACRTDRYRVVVDMGRDGTPRYRAWDEGHSIAEKPDAEVAGGKEEYSGKGGCGHIEWSFTDGPMKFEVSELGCFPDSNQPPPAATGYLAMDSEHPKAHEFWWCD